MTINPYKIAFVFMIMLSAVEALGQNKLLDRSFWKSNPDLKTVKTLIENGNSATDLNSNSFDAMSWALIENAPNNILEYLLEFEGNGVNKLTHDGRSYIFWATYGNNLEFMKTLIDRGAKTDIIDEHGYSLLNFCAATGNQEQKIYDFIIDHGSKPRNEVNRDGANALLLLIPFLKTTEFIDYFKNFGLSIHDKDKNGASSLMYAVKGQNFPMIQFLIDSGLDLNEKDKKNQNAVHYAAKRQRGQTKNLEIFKYLKKAGLQINEISESGETPLTIYAARNSRKDIIDFLVENGNDPFHIPNEGRSAFISISGKNTLIKLSSFNPNSESINFKTSKGETALHQAVKYGSLENLNFLLDNGANVHALNKDSKNLINYLFEGYRESDHKSFIAKANLLKKNGFNFSSILPDGNSLFHLAVDQNKISLIDYLPGNEKHINHINNDGITALHHAVMSSKDLSLIKALIDKGADASILTLFGETTMELAGENELLKPYANDFKIILAK